MGRVCFGPPTLKRQAVEVAVDQAVSSLITFGLSIYAARQASVSDFGVFAVAYALFWVFLGTTRSFVSEVNLIAGTEKLERTGRWRSFSGTISLFAGAFSGVVLVVGFLVIGSADAMWIGWSFAASAPIAIFADSIRYVAFTDDAPGDALVLDAMWLGGALLVPPVIGAMGTHPVPAAILGWGIGAAAGVGVALIRRPQLRPSLKGAVKWIADRRVVGTQFAADFLANNGIGQAATMLVPLVSSIAVAGALRAGGVIQGPLNVVFSAMIVFLIPRIRRSIPDGRVLPRPAPLAVVALAVFCSVYAAAVLLIPDSLGEFLLGASWHSGRSVAPLLIAAFFLQGMAQILVQVMRLRNSAGLVVRVRVVVAVLLTIGVLAGAAFFGAIGAASAFVMAALISIAPWWFALVRSHRRFQDDGSGSS